MPDPRVPLLSIDEAKAIAAEVDVPAQMAELSIFRILLRQPKLAKRVNDMLVTLLLESTFDARLRELIIMRIGWSTKAVYEWTQHWRVATEMEIPEEDLLAVRDWRSASGLSEADRAVLAATDETLADGAISPETWALCERHVGGREELVELVAAIGCWRMISSVLRSLEVPLEDGVAPWPPDGATPGP